jgi:hypothetical protein
MTIEIKQLVIRALVERKPKPAAPAARTPAESARHGAPPVQHESFDREALVADCARLVLRELRKERER